MRTFIATALALAFASSLALAAGGQGIKLEKAHVDITDKASLQRGARLFVNYCMGCHSLQFMRYNRMGEDLGLTEEQLSENFIFNDAKVGDLMTNAMPRDKAENWFGKAPPDLSVISRSRGADWLNGFLKSYYLDPNKPTGMNNRVFPDVGMPNALWALQGTQRAVFHEQRGETGKVVRAFERFEPVTEGSMTPKEYDRAVRDLVNFLVYVGEPSALQRRESAPYVIAFLILFTILAYLLKKEYWRDVH